jgi:hypothetical protein
MSREREKDLIERKHEKVSYTLVLLSKPCMLDISNKYSSSQPLIIINTL